MPDLLQGAAIAAFRGEHRFLSNFWRHPFAWKGQSWPTSEHAFQAAKCVRSEQAEQIRLAAAPGEAKRLGRRAEMRPDWDEVKDEVMADILRHKFRDPKLRRRLLGTGTAQLIEGNSWGDTYWGVCRGKGKNRLGILLMGLRSELAEEARLAALAATHAAPQP